MHIDSVFVCYRREDSVAHAGRIYDRLATRFGKNRVVMDIDTIRPGEDFIDVIEQRVSACDAVVAIIGKTWLTSQDDEGKRRLDDPDYYVRREIAAALSNILIIPALVGGARMPRAVDLPGEIRPLARRNALEIIDTAFDSSAAKLIESLDAGIQEARARKATAPPDTQSARPDPEPGPSETGDSVLVSEDRDSALPRSARLAVPRLVGIAGVVLLLFVSFVTSYLGRSSARQDAASSVPSESTQKVPSPTTEAGASARSPQGADKGQTSRPSRPTSTTKQTPAPEEGQRREKVVPRPESRAATKEPQAATDKSVPPLRNSASAPPPPATPVRVGGNIAPPEKLRHVAPVYPQLAQSARVSGIVIIEATINTQGKVSPAYVLRGIPLLNDAALDAVRQWEYRPTLLNGVPVPVIMTVTVNFSLIDQRRFLLSFVRHLEVNSDIETARNMLREVFGATPPSSKSAVFRDLKGQVELATQAQMDEAEEFARQRGLRREP